MLKKSVIFVVSAFAIIVLIAAIFNSRVTPVPAQYGDRGGTIPPQDKPVSVQPTPTQSIPDTTASPTPAPTTYTLAQVATHATASDCWTAVNGSVYDVTSWISRHPGGQRAILSMCGKDGSASFDDQHGGERRPANELASFKIGTLTN